MQKYKCHKVVEAGIITAIDMPGSTWGDDRVGFVHLMDGSKVEITGKFVARNCPPPFNDKDGDTTKRMQRLVGSYLVRYADGYLSVSPAQAFEEGYAPEQSQEEREQRRQDFMAACRPLMEWLNKNGHPHMKAIVDQCDVELVEGVMSGRDESMLRD